LADPEAITDELNPLVINHTARTISFKAIGEPKKTMAFGKGIRSSIPNKAPVNNNTAAMRPQTDINQGMIFDLYNK